jgi:Aromatic-ring-opening dioxygenase LigAB, LigA subunit
LANEFDPDLPSNRMIYEVRRDNAVWPRFAEDFEVIMDRYGLSEAEKQAWRSIDLPVLAELGMHPYFLPQVTRLMRGSAQNHSQSPAALAYRSAFGSRIVE